MISFTAMIASFCSYANKGGIVSETFRRAKLVGLDGTGAV
jgi:hypothetical protein